MKRKTVILALCALVLVPRPAATGFPVFDAPNLAQAIREMVVSTARNTILGEAKDAAEAARKNAIALTKGTPGSWTQIRTLIGNLKKVQALAPNVVQQIAAYNDASTLLGLADPGALGAADIQSAWQTISALDTSAGVFNTILATGAHGTDAVARYTARREHRAAARGNQAAASAARAQAAAELAKVATEATTKNDQNKNAGAGAALTLLSPNDEPSPEQKLLAGQVTLNNLVAASAHQAAVEARLAAAETERVQRASAAQATAQAAVAEARHAARQAWLTYGTSIGAEVDRGNQLLAWIGTYTATAAGYDAGPPSVSMTSGAAPAGPVMPTAIN